MSADRRLDLVGFGSMVVDRLHCAPRIVGPDEKGPLRALERGGFVRCFVGGVILNQLGWAAALGLHTGLFGRQGDDEEGRWLRAAMDGAGIQHRLRLDGSASSVAEIFVDDAGERAIYFAPGATAETTAEHLRGHASFLRRGLRLTTEVHQLPLEAVCAALRLARDAGLSTVVDVDMAPSEVVPALGSEAHLTQVLETAELLKPAKRAARELGRGGESDALEQARHMRARFGSRAVVVTDGEAGCAIAADGFEGVVPAYPVKALDATGAGDAFLGGLLAGLHHELAWPDAARLGNACGAACVERFGGFPEDPAAARARVLELYDGRPFEPRPLWAGHPETGPGHEALATFDVALAELAAVRRRLDPAAFDAALVLIRRAETSGSRLHLTGVGKPEHVARYGAALFASTGTPATFLQATEAAHGSAGQVVAGDVVIAVSNSGETAELRLAVVTVRKLGARVVAVTGDADSWLAREADVTLVARVEREGGGLGLAPRASVAAELLVVAGLAAALERDRGFTRSDYLARHPAGKLGRRARRG